MFTLHKWLGILLLTPALVGCKHLGQKSAPVVSLMPKRNIVLPTEASKRKIMGDHYIVNKGETLTAIGAQYGLTYKELAQLNNIAEPYNIYPGQQLVVSAKIEKKVPAIAASSMRFNPRNNRVLIKPTMVVRDTPAKDLVKDEKPLQNKLKSEELVKPAGMIAERSMPEKKANVKQAIINVAEAKVSKSDVKAQSPLPSKIAPLSQQALSKKHWLWPTSGQIITRFQENPAINKGIDIANNKGTPIKATKPGKVVYSGEGLRGYGRLLIIKHEEDYLSAYAHNEELLVKEGQHVEQGQVIATMGQSDSDRVKLHFEIRHNGKPVDPLGYLPGQKT